MKNLRRIFSFLADSLIGIEKFSTTVRRDRAVDLRPLTMVRMFFETFANHLRISQKLTMEFLALRFSWQIAKP